VIHWNHEKTYERVNVYTFTRNFNASQANTLTIPPSNYRINTSEGWSRSHVHTLFLDAVKVVAGSDENLVVH